MQRALIAAALPATLLVTLLAGRTACAAIRPSAQSVACVPGGVAAIPLMREPSDTWPATLPVQIDELMTMGTVVWIGTRDDGQRFWTRSPDHVDVRAIADAPSHAPPENTGAVMVLVEMPAITGAVRVMGVPLEAHWLARTAWTLGGTAPAPWPMAPALDLPDTTTPSEYWRWCLLAQRRGQQPPAPVGNAAEKLWAQHIAWLWIAGLQRVRQASPGIYTELLEALTNTAVDPHLPPPGDVAGWIAGPNDLRALLAVLLESSPRNEQIAQSALSWLRAHWQITTWVECDAGDRVRIVAVNPTGGEQVMRLTWVEQGDAIPESMLLPPRSVVRQWIDRPPLSAPNTLLPIERLRGDRLYAAVGDLRKQIPVGPREYPVRPPGLSFGVFLPPLSLAEAQAGAIEPPPPEWRGWASLRRRQSRWELLVECMHPPASASAAASTTASSSPLPTASDSADEVAVILGDPEAPMRVIRVSADGRFGVDGGADDAAAAGFMRWNDRWRARIEMPDVWIPAATGGGHGTGASRPVMLSLVRKLGALPRQTAALAVPSWTQGTPPVLIDLGAWTDPAPR